MSVKLPVVTNCDGCGACCMSMGTPPFAGPGDPSWDALPEQLKAEIKAEVFRPGRNYDGPCIWLENGRCKHHAIRPMICREFEIGSPACLIWRDEHGVEKLSYRERDKANRMNERHADMIVAGRIGTAKLAKRKPSSNP